MAGLIGVFFSRYIIAALVIWWVPTALITGATGYSLTKVGACVAAVMIAIALLPSADRRRGNGGS